MTAPTLLNASIDELLAAALRGEIAAWPGDWASEECQSAVVERALYHGLAGLLVERGDRLVGWPDNVIGPLREQALALAMWELRHQRVLAGLFAALAAQNVTVAILKGTAVAYDLYANPATRARGDTDILACPEDVSSVRTILSQQGFVLDPNAEHEDAQLLLQEIWHLDYADGSGHDIDLHWQAMNAPALDGILNTADCFANLAELPRLCHAAWAVDRVTLLLHTILHRTGHITSPYFVGNVAYYGGDRLIWAEDIHRLATSLSQAEWREFADRACAEGVAAVCLDGLQFARARLGTEPPASVMRALEAAPQGGRAARYLLHSGQLARAWQDFLAQSGWRRRAAYLAARVLPTPAFVRGKYPGMAGRPLPLLYLRRAADLLRARPQRSEH